MPGIDLRPAAGRLGALIEAVPEDDLGRPTPCSEYCVGDLLDHVQGLTIAFVGAAVKADGPSSTMGPSGTAADLEAGWRKSLPVRLMNLADTWQDPEAWTGMTRVGGQDLPGEVAGIVTFGELSIHGWDLARATQLPFEPDPEGVGPLFKLIQQTFGSGQGAPRGPAFAPAVPVPGDAPMFHQILGLLGRDPQWPDE